MVGAAQRCWFRRRLGQGGSKDRSEPEAESAPPGGSPTLVRSPRRCLSGLEGLSGGATAALGCGLWLAVVTVVSGWSLRYRSTKGTSCEGRGGDRGSVECIGDRVRRVSPSLVSLQWDPLHLYGWLWAASEVTRPR